MSLERTRGNSVDAGRAGGGSGTITLLLASVAWIVCSLIFLDIAWAKVADLRSAGQYVSPWRYGQVLFWIALLTFWIWKSWTSFHQYRSARKVS